MPSRSLWNDPSAEPGHEWFAQAAAPPRRPREEPPPEPPRAPRWRRAVIGLTVVIALLGAGLVVSDLLDGGGSEEVEEVAALPAVTGGAGTSRVKEIYARASKAVVSVRVARGGAGGSGTGFLIDDDGTVVTNAHVVRGGNQVQVRADESRRPVSAQVVGVDASTDLAVLRIDAADADGLTALPLADSDDVAVGDPVVAIGYPLGLDRTATAGIVSGLGRQIEAPNGFSIDEVIQTDAPINPGNSGGPLIDARGRVIGVNSQIATAGGGAGNVGIGFAVPSNTVREVVPQLAAGRTIARAWLGVSTSPTPNNRGAVVQEVTPGGPAERAGLRPGRTMTGAGGDVIVAVEGTDVSDPEDVAAAIAARSPGDRIEVRVRRNGREQAIEVELGRRPTNAP